jgi:2-keto-4-pentenoate hydratase/2-oxohepta-3-ene-1,7-dioic acid hydratase in catechol pathway
MKVAKVDNKYYAINGSTLIDLKKFSLEYLMYEDMVKDLEMEINNKEGIPLPPVMDPPVTPPKILAAGLNYADHAKETHQEPPKEPIFFQKASTAIIGYGQNIILPKSVNQLDYEAELAVVIGKKGKYISNDEAYEYVLGYTIMNDVSSRDHQFRYNKQWFVGKSFDTFAPLGPCIVDKWSIGNPQSLNIECKVNGITKQNSNTSKMIFDIPTLIEFISNVLTLEQFDVISTGTPAGVALSKTPGQYLKDNDIVEINIENIGVLKNTIKSENR